MRSRSLRALATSPLRAAPSPRANQVIDCAIGNLSHDSSEGWKTRAAASAHCRRSSA